VRITAAEYVACRILDPVMHSLREEVVRLAAMRTGQRALDVCCGVGSQVLRFAERDLVATGVDLDPRMTRRAEKRRRRRGLRNASFQRASAVALPFRNDTFDCASISLALHETAETQRKSVLSEMKRVVVQEGRLVFVDYVVPLPRTPSGYLSIFLEYLAGHEHYGAFRSFLDRGGLDELLRENRVCQEEFSQLGPVAVVAARNVKT
jgi:ubiquinone/menaquinone biosynthesis C-methylase UbiE